MLFILHSGCWGVKINRDRPRIALAAENMFSIIHLHEYDFDQILLDRFIWPVAKNDVVICLRCMNKKDIFLMQEPLCF